MQYTNNDINHNIESILNKGMYLFLSMYLFCDCEPDKRNDHQIMPLFNMLFDTLTLFYVNHPNKTHSIFQRWYNCCKNKLCILQNVISASTPKNPEISNTYNHLLAICVILGNYSAFKHYYLKTGVDENATWNQFNDRFQFAQYQLLPITERVDIVCKTFGLRNLMDSIANLGLFDINKYNRFRSNKTGSAVCFAVQDAEKSRILRNIASCKQCHWNGCLRQNAKLRRCQKCLSVYYCSRKCQKMDWNLSINGKLSHRFTCKKLNKRNHQYYFYHRFHYLYHFLSCIGQHQNCRIF